MTSVPDEPDRQIAEAVLPVPPDEPALPLPLDKLAPWHRVRKQLVREQQWLRYSERLITNQRGRPALPDQVGHRPEVRYLTLPGVDYLDVRLLAGLCDSLDCCLTSTGFQAGNERNQSVARAQLRQKSLIDAQYITPDSHTFARRFEEVSERNSNAYRDLERRGPFHIVNVDACGSIAAPTAFHSRRIVEALHRLVELQLGLMNGRWLLFVTTDVRPDSIAQETLVQLCEAIYSNADTNADFAQLATPLLDPAASDIRAAAASASQLPGANFLCLFSLGLAKWLLSLTRQRQWDMRTHHPYCYTTMPQQNPTPSMACLAFEFRPPPADLEDRFSISRAQPSSASQAEDSSIRAAQQISMMTNADSRVQTDEALFERLAGNLRCLLREAGYPTALLNRIEA